MYQDHELSILIMDGEVEGRTSLYSLLDAQGCRVATRRPDAEALKYLATHKPEVAVLGRMASQGDRNAFVRQMKKVSPTTRFLLLVEPGHTLGPVDPRVAEGETQIERPCALTNNSPAVERLLGAVFQTV